MMWITKVGEVCLNMRARTGQMLANDVEELEVAMSYKRARICGVVQTGLLCEPT